MIDHSQYRRALLADPHREDDELLAHRAECAPCRAFTSRVLAFEAKLDRTIKDAVMPGSLALKPRARAAQRPRWLAVAASVTVALAAMGVAWLAVPRSSLAADVVAHMAGEPDAWAPRDALPANAVEPILQRAHLALDRNKLTVSYASPCTFRGHLVPHLVVQSPAGPVTVMVLTHEPLSKPEHFDEQGYRGTLVPIPGHGSLAVLMHTPAGTAAGEAGAGEAAAVQAVADEVRGAIVWSP